MRILAINLVNFMSYESLKLEFNDFKGITLLSGSNGSGKSSIFDAICWGLFGKTNRNIPVDSVIKNESSSCEVWLSIEVSSDIIEVKRRRSRSGALDLVISGVDADGTVSGKQAILERKLGFDYRNFTNTVMFGSNVSSFCGMTDSERKKVIEGLLGLDIYNRALMLAKKDNVAYSSKLQDLINKRNNIESQIEIVSSNIIGYKKSSNNFHKDWLISGLAFIKDLGELYETEMELSAEYFEERMKVRALQESYDAKDSDYSITLSKIKEEKAARDAELRRVTNEMNEIKQMKRELIREIENNKAFNESHKDGVCPMCKQVLPVSYAVEYKDTDSIVARIEELDVRYKTLFNTESKLNRKIEEISNQMLDIERPQLPDYVLLNRIRTMLNKNIATQKQVKLRENKHKESQENPFKLMVEKASIKLEVYSENLTKIKKEMLEMREYVFIAEYWEKAFHYNGIPSYLMDSILPIIARYADLYSDELTDSELQVDFIQQKSGKLDVVVDYKNGGNEYGSVSTGERTRADLVVLFAIRDALEYVYKGGRMHQMFIDEVFNGLDADGVEAVMSVLRTQFKDKQIFLVSHDDTLKSLADNVIHIYKEDKKTVVAY